MRSLILTPEALEDIRDAFHWYERKRFGLGAEFERALEAALTRIQRTPDSFRRVVDDFRRLPLRRFPYDVYCEYDDSKVVVAFVFHTARDPDAAIARLQKH